MTQLTDGAIHRLRQLVELPPLESERYMILEKIGSGGMGNVYLAADRDLQRKVAIKVVKPFRAGEQVNDRMVKEAKIIAQLEHPGIIPIHDAGILPDGQLYYVMKFVEGTRFDDVIRSQRSRTELLRMFQRVCEAIAFAHSRGIVHRDLKPENIMVGSFGEVLVMDWGVAKIIAGTSVNSEVPLQSTTEHGTSAGTVIGTAPYMAPEQAEGKPEEHQPHSDIYSLGAILYQILTGNPPPVLAKPAMEREPGGTKTPKQLFSICVKAMSPLPRDRYFSALDLSQDISRYLDGEAVSAYRENILEKTGRWLSHNRLLAWLFIAYLLMRVIVFFIAGR